MTDPHLALVVDDDDDARDLVVHVLSSAGMDVVTAATGAEGLETARRRDPDLVTLDLMLPDMDGTEVCRQLREFSDAYVVMITGRSSEVDRLVGLEIGADDYLSKPFSPQELRGRAAALLRRPRQSTAAQAGLVTGVSSPGPDVEDEQVDLGGGLVLVASRHLVTLQGRPLPLTPPEFELLAVLASRPGGTWRRGELVRELWQGDFVESDFLVDVQVASVRRKLKAASGRDWVRTVGGAGYCFQSD